jgi:hypothetical protein
MLEVLLSEIAKSPPPSPTGEMPKVTNGKHIVWAPLEVSKTTQYVAAEPEYEYDDGEEDLESLALSKIPTRRPQR